MDKKRAAFSGDSTSGEIMRTGYHFNPTKITLNQRTVMALER